MSTLVGLSVCLSVRLSVCMSVCGKNSKCVFKWNVKLHLKTKVVGHINKTPKILLNIVGRSLGQSVCLCVYGK